MSILKADEFGLLGDLAPVHVTGVVHNTAEMRRRLDYVRLRLAQGTATITLIAVSEAVRRYLVDEAGIASGNVRTVHNGIDVRAFCRRVKQARHYGMFERVRARNGLPTEGRMLLTSARRVAWKGHLDVLHAVKLLIARDHRDFYIVFNGAGLVDSRVPEPFGYANIKAMLASVPVITTAHGGPLEYITHGISGLLVPPNDPPTLATAIDTLLSDQQLHARLAVGGRASAGRFGLNAMVRGYEGAIRAHLTEQR